MRSFIPEELSTRQRHQYLLGSVNPRPICFASTVSLEGQPNLAPYSFFNIFSSTPPIFIVSVNTRRDGSHKDTLRNARETGQLVINMVNENFARQMAIAGIEYPSNINEFEKAGLTAIPSLRIKPFRIKESPVHFECEILEIKSLGQHAGSANLIIAQAVLIHMDENIFGPEDTIDPNKIGLVGRLGDHNYCVAKEDKVFAIKQTPSEIALGFDSLPEDIRHSSLLTGNLLALLAGVTHKPAPEALTVYAGQHETRHWMNNLPQDAALRITLIHQKVRSLLENGHIDEAWMTILLTKQEP